jgi:delta14-sterol reductase
MWLYLTGATMLGLNALSFMAHHWILYGDQASAGILLSTALIIYFVVDYLIFEEVHLFTYDLFAEKIGFKLGWGCIVFYPYFYSVFLWATVDICSYFLCRVDFSPWCQYAEVFFQKKS